jgi:hypothetical protein
MRQNQRVGLNRVEPREIEPGAGPGEEQQEVGPIWQLEWKLRGRGQHGRGRGKALLHSSFLHWLDVVFF